MYGAITSADVPVHGQTILSEEFQVSEAVFGPVSTVEIVLGNAYGGKEQHRSEKTYNSKEYVYQILDGGF